MTEKELDKIRWSVSVNDANTVALIDEVDRLRVENRKLREAWGEAAEILEATGFDKTVARLRGAFEGGSGC